MPSPADYPEASQALLHCIQALASQGLSPATGGNFSTRLPDNTVLITQSGRDKTRISHDDLMLCNLKGESLQAACVPSAETALHTRLYQLDERIQCVLHTHSVYATVLSRHCAEDRLQITGFEMQKSLHGVTSHEDCVHIPVFENNQDIPALADEVSRYWTDTAPPGLLVRGHGLYAWGRSVAEAQRHIEGLEFLFQCLVTEIQLGHRT